jgi:hypothetical protein
MGYVEGRNVAIEIRGADQYDHLAFSTSASNESATPRGSVQFREASGTTYARGRRLVTLP